MASLATKAHCWLMVVLPSTRNLKIFFFFTALQQVNPQPILIHCSFPGSLDLLSVSMHHRERGEKSVFSICFICLCSNAVYLSYQLLTTVVMLICVHYVCYLELDSFCKVRYYSKVHDFQLSVTTDFQSLNIKATFVRRSQF